MACLPVSLMVSCESGEGKTGRPRALRLGPSRAPPGAALYIFPGFIPASIAAPSASSYAAAQCSAKPSGSSCESRASA